MSFFSKITNFLTGGLASKITDKVLAQFPDKLSESERITIQAAIDREVRDHEKSLLELANEQDKEFNRRITAMEGTAKDLQQFGFIGKLLILLRGSQRPLWGFTVLYMDIKIFSGEWKLVELSQTMGEASIYLNLQSSFWLINFLVLGFLFGERAMKNVAPLLKGLKS